MKRLVNELVELIAGGDYGWKTATPPRREILLDTRSVPTEASVLLIATAMQGLGHFEWEVMLAYWLLSAIEMDHRTHERLDITEKVFGRTLMASKGREIVPKEILERLCQRFFEVASDDGNFMVLAVRKMR